MCRKALLTQSVCLRDECGQLIHLPFDIDDAYIICLTGDHYPAVLAQCDAYLEKQPSDPYPVALSIFDLDVLAFYLSDPFEFAYYLRQRLLFAEHFLADSELSLLGFHLCERLVAAEGCDLMWVTGDYGQLIDAHFPIATGHRFNQVAVGELGFRWRSDTFDVLINQFKSMQEELTTDALFFLFDLDSTVCGKIFDKFDELKEATRRDGKRHSVSIQVPGSKSGFTLMVYPMAGVNEDEFYFIAMKRKYSTRSDEWFALMGTEDRSRLFHTCFYNKTPWQEDSKWESLGAEESMV